MFAIGVAHFGKTMVVTDGALQLEGLPNITMSLGTTFSVRIDSIMIPFNPSSRSCYDYYVATRQVNALSCSLCIVNTVRFIHTSCGRPRH